MARPRRPGRHRAARYAGAALLIAGAILLGAAGWQLYGSNWTAQRHHAEVRDELEHTWNRGDPEASTPYGDAIAVVRIPRFGDDYEVPVLEGTTDETLAAGLGHYEQTAAPGQAGNFAVAGHRITHGQPLRDMPDLRAGDVVEVETADAIYTYRLTTDGDALVVDDADTSVLEPDPTSARATTGSSTDLASPIAAGARTLTLTACARLVPTSERLVAYGVLQRTDPKPS
ncbi:class E sortase [Nocardioides sp. W7]|uniref:class E sortase n=1 Tax=Nocardioides sp. W7 TaxID=2931390 RepID=UPI001FD57658|nr:class E sortase [Nocardioides sp. W7]